LLKRIKRRYLALEIDSSVAFGSKELMDAIWNAVSKLFGEYGASQAGLTLIDYDVERRLVVIRAAHTALGMVHAALASITRIQDKPVAIHVLTVSGTIKTLYERINK
jgi:ribonuclease P/MRP protein subunit POP5